MNNPSFVESFTEFRRYLVLYIKKRGILEIWRLNHGGKVYSKFIGHNCSLIKCSKTPKEDQIFFFDAISKVISHIADILDYEYN